MRDQSLMPRTPSVKNWDTFLHLNIKYKLNSSHVPSRFPPPNWKILIMSKYYTLLGFLKSVRLEGILEVSCSCESENMEKLTPHKDMRIADLKTSASDARGILRTDSCAGILRTPSPWREKLRARNVPELILTKLSVISYSKSSTVHKNKLTLFVNEKLQSQVF